MDKYLLAQDIGQFFGCYFEEDGMVCIDNGDEVYEYETVDDLLADWVDTLVESQYDGAPPSCCWEKEIVFIYEESVGKLPTGVRKVEGRDGGISWSCSVDVPDPDNKHGKNLHLGTYGSIVDAIWARREFLENNKDKGLDEMIASAREQRTAAKDLRKERKEIERI